MKCKSAMVLAGLTRGHESEQEKTLAQSKLLFFSTTWQRSR